MLHLGKIFWSVLRSEVCVCVCGEEEAIPVGGNICWRVPGRLGSVGRIERGHGVWKTITFLSLTKINRLEIGNVCVK